MICVERDLEVTMRDGVTLRADVYRPADGGPVPALLERTPYGKGNGRYVGGLIFNPLDAVERGYAVVVQDVRGRNRSEGAWEPFVNERDDGHDTIEWIAQQPWCDGIVGLYGASYMGATALQAATGAPPAVKGIVLYMTGSNFFHEWTYSGGAFELRFNLVWTLRSLVPDTLRKIEDTAERERELETYVGNASRLPALVHELPLDDPAAFRRGAPYWRVWHEHAEYDDYWERVDATRRAENVRAPVLHVSGWYDHFLRGHLDLYRALDDAGVEQQMLLGPWDHGSYHSTSPTMSGERDFGPRAINGPALMSDLALGWFDRCLSSEAPALRQQPAVRYFVMGENRWRDAGTWPPEHASTPWYLRSDGALSEETPAQEPADEYVYDPRNPIPTVGGRGSTSVLGAAGVQDQRRLGDRADVLRYTSPPLTSSLTIAGPVVVRLYVEATTPAADFVARLVDVEPSGYCANLADGIARRLELPPDGVLELEIDLWAVAHRFDAGHRLRLEISGGSFPRWDRNPQTGTHPAAARVDELRISTHTVFHDGERPSCVLLPVLAGGT